jgi:hypothetical protein
VDATVPSYWLKWVLLTFCLEWPQTAIFPISPSQVAVSHCAWLICCVLISIYLKIFSNFPDNFLFDQWVIRRMLLGDWAGKSSKAIIKKKCETNKKRKM